MTPPADLTLRPAVAGDHAFMFSLAPRLVAALPAWRDRTAALTHYAALFQEVLAESRKPEEDQSEITVVLLAERGGEPQGFTVLYLLRDERALFIKDFAVSEQAEGNGTAQFMMRAVQAWARERGCTEIGLKTGWNNVRARAFYERAGFQYDHVMMVQPL